MSDNPYSTENLETSDYGRDHPNGTGLVALLFLVLLFDALAGMVIGALVF
ncbi:hypothetical protein [Celeribacter halophilus]|nr:hypothetical protein [Celeribacter halophilus]